MTAGVKEDHSVILFSVLGRRVVYVSYSLIHYPEDRIFSDPKMKSFLESFELR